MRTSWILLFIAIAVEISSTTGMKALAADHPAWSLAVATIGITISYFFASRAMEKMPVGLAYAVWSGVGIAGVSVLSWFFFAEAMPLVKICGVIFIIVGMVVINLSGQGAKTASPQKAKSI